eukprot:CAMPEP_0117685760 /NCGR_PEP_ID=MMETSP0804-20121206/21969_1 /TAXON_ID=1074897 /ORGANISM="Tetraselmis astigmatica, Strain CCMP880" /LENGTH=147 /DNA_ID=CAMNT_0005497169 /DNA_START=683 /DNA_END=1126 /DNA_ORIENTATION=-
MTSSSSLLTRFRSRDRMASLSSSERKWALPSFSRMSTLVLTLLTFCPPDPPLRANFISTSPISTFRKRSSETEAAAQIDSPRVRAEKAPLGGGEVQQAAYRCSDPWLPPDCWAEGEDVALPGFTSHPPTGARALWAAFGRPQAVAAP